MQEAQEELSLGGFFQVSLSQREPGLTEIKGWDGGMSSPEVTIRYREFEQDGRKMLQYARSTPANPFMVEAAPRPSPPRCRWLKARAGNFVSRQQAGGG